MKKRKSQDSVEAMLRQADAAMKQLDHAARAKAQQAVISGAGALRRQVEDLQVGLKKLSAGLARLEQRHTTRSTRPRPRRAAVARPATRARRRRPVSHKKAA
jgi:hypothetical protein